MRTLMSFHTVKFTEVIGRIKGTHFAVKISHGRDNVDSSMQSSAGKEIEIRTALSSPFHDGLTPDSRKIQTEITSVDFWKVNLYL